MMFSGLLYCTYQCTYQYIMPEVKQTNSLKVRSILHEDAAEFTPTLKGAKNFG